MGWLRVADICSTLDGIQLKDWRPEEWGLDHWTGALLVERTLVVLASGFNCVHFLRELWRLRQLAGGGTRQPRGPRGGRAMRAAVVAMVVINASLVVGALHPLAAARFAAVGRSPGLEVVAVGVSLTAALFMTALVMRERK